MMLQFIIAGRHRCRDLFEIIAKNLLMFLKHVFSNI